MAKLPLTHVNIIQMLGLESMPLDERKEIIESAVELVEARTLNRVMAAMPEADREQLTGLIDGKESDAVHDLLQKNNINLIAITEEEVEKVKEELLSQTLE